MLAEYRAHPKWDLTAEEDGVVDALSADQIDAIDRELLAVVEPRRLKVARIVGDVLLSVERGNGSLHGLPSIFVAARVHQLALRDLVALYGDPLRMRFSEAARREVVPDVKQGLLADLPVVRDYPLITARFSGQDGDLWRAFYAAQENEPEALPEAMDARLLGQSDAEGWKPLHEAAAYGACTVIRRLVQLGANIHARGGAEKWSPLQRAAAACSSDAVQLLIELGADVNERTPKGEPLAQLVLQHLPSVPEKAQRHVLLAAESVLSRLFDAGVDPRELNQDGESLMDLAMRLGLASTQAFLEARLRSTKS